VLCAMHAAEWRPADPVTLSSSVRIVGSVLFDRPYLDAPVSPLFYENRKQDLAFEKPDGKSARTRHHVRFWKALDAGDDGLPVWLGAAVFDDGLGVSHYTGQVTHHTAADIDAERDFLMSDLEQAKKVEEIYSVESVQPCSRAMAAATAISPTATSLSASSSPAARVRQARRAHSSHRRGSRRKTHSSHSSRRYGAACIGHGAAGRRERRRGRRSSGCRQSNPRTPRSCRGSTIPGHRARWRRRGRARGARRHAPCAPGPLACRGG
jgi:hypothetical protein